MNSVTNQMRKNDADCNEPTHYANAHTELASYNELETGDIVDAHSWELEVEHAVVLSNN